MASKNKHKVTKALQDALVFCQKGQLHEARNIYQKLIKVIPTNDQMLANFGTIELQIGNIEYATELLDRSLLIKPNQPNILNNLGNYFLESGDPQKSIKYYDMAISLNLQNYEALYNKGRAMTATNKIEEAIECYMQAIKINPENKIAHLNLGFVFNLTKSFDEAINEYNIVIDMDESSSEAFFSRGIAYSNKGDHEKAIMDFNIAIKRNFNARFIFKRAASFEKLENFSEALTDYSQIINSDLSTKDRGKAYCLRGELKNKMDNLESGMADIEMALKLEPSNADFYNDYANGYKKLNKNLEAVKHLKKAIDLDPEHHISKLNLSYFELATHDYKKGWRHYESRWMVPELKLISLITNKPKLENFEVKNQKILIWGEQGLGDYIFFSTMLSDALRTENKFIVLLDSRLLDLYKTSFKDFKNVVFLNNIDNEDLYDFHLPFGSLGRFFRTSKQDFLKQKIPLLVSNKEYIEVLKNKIKSEKKYVCGISWMSKAANIGEIKSMRLEDLQSVISLPDIDFVDLQYGDTKKEKKEFKDKFGYELMEMTDIDNFNDISKLASLVNACDFVITTSNITAHLAGALNKKTYLIVPFTDGKGWYWGINEDSSIWYPSIKVLRSENLKDWKNPIKNLLNLLSQEIIHERDN